jgi:hypothetical protein
MIESTSVICSKLIISSILFRVILLCSLYTVSCAVLLIWRSNYEVPFLCCCTSMICGSTLSIHAYSKIRRNTESETASSRDNINYRTENPGQYVYSKVPMQVEAS